MSPTLAGRNGVFSWSPCSRQYLHKFLRYELLETVVYRLVPLISLPGQLAPVQAAPGSDVASPYGSHLKVSCNTHLTKAYGKHFLRALSPEGLF